MDKKLLKVCCLIFTALFIGGCNLLSYFPTATPTIMSPTQTNTPVIPTATPTQMPTYTVTPTSTLPPTPIFVQRTPSGISHATKLCYRNGGNTKSDQWIGGTQWVEQIFFTYNGGTVILSGSNDGSKPFHLDDAFRITILHPNKTQDVFYYEMYDPDCAGGYVCEAGPFNITKYFSPGINTVKIEIIDLYPEAWDVSTLYLVEFTNN